MAPSPPPSSRRVPFRFSGDEKEYFRIWIVNVALTLVTLGVYSAWAKVRTKKYFYRSTWLEDASFDYLADPVRILKGRIIIAAAAGLVFGSQFYSLPLYATLLAALVLITPFVVVRALAFNARNSAYRNVRFSFVGNAGEAIGVYLQLVLAYVLTCGLGYPYTQWRLTEFVVQRHLFGDERFTWSTKSGDYFRVFLVAAAMTLPVIAVVLGVLLATAASHDPGTEMGSAALAPMALLYAFLLVPAAYVRAKLANALYNGLRVGPHCFESDQRPLDLVKLYFTNGLGILISLGLLIPWARIRLARYRAEHLTLIATGPLHAGNFELARDPSAFGDAATDLGDFDLDLGV